MPKIRLSPFPESPNRAIPAVPNNYGMVDHANIELSRTIAVATARYSEAMRVDGVPVMLWRKSRRGRVCTCQSDSDTRPIVEEIGDGDKPIADTPARTPPISSSPIRVRGSRELDAETPAVKDTVLGVAYGQEGTEGGRFVEDALGAGSGIDGAAFLDDASQRSFLDSGQSTTTCGICFGTGYTEGYNLFCGQRIVLANFNVTKNEGFAQFDEEDGPIGFRGDEGATLSWQITVPLFFQESWITARDNVRPATVDILIDGAPLALQGLQAYRGKTVLLSARAATDDTEITHVQIVLRTAEWPRTQVPQITEDLSRSAPEATQTLDFPFTPEVPKVNQGDAFVDFKYGKVWKIGSVTDYQTNQGQQISWQVSATSRTQFDVLSLLKAVKYPSYALSFRNFEF